jgi:GABA permease
VTITATLIAQRSRGVIAAAVSPDTVSLFLLNSSGAIILFVYLLIAVSQVVLRRKTPPERLAVKMWLFPFLSLLTIAGIVAVLLQMALTDEVRPQLLLSLLSWGLVLVLYFVTARLDGSMDASELPQASSPSVAATRVLVLANETVAADELLDELHQIDRDGKAVYFVCVPANPVDTGQAEHKGAVFLWEATKEAAQRRLDYMLETLRGNGLEADGAMGDYRPLRALAEAVESFKPDRLVISTLDLERSTWLRYDVVERARKAYDIPVTHVICRTPVTAGS